MDLLIWPSAATDDDPLEGTYGASPPKVIGVDKDTDIDVGVGRGLPGSVTAFDEPDPPYSSPSISATSNCFFRFRRFVVERERRIGWVVAGVGVLGAVLVVVVVRGVVVRCVLVAAADGAFWSNMACLALKNVILSSAFGLRISLGVIPNRNERMGSSRSRSMQPYFSAVFEQRFGSSTVVCL